MAGRGPRWTRRRERGRLGQKSAESAVGRGRLGRRLPGGVGGNFPF